MRLLINNINVNVPTLGEEADLKAKTFSLAPTPKGIANVQFSTKTAFLPNCLLAVRSFSFDCQN